MNEELNIKLQTLQLLQVKVLHCRGKEKLKKISLN
jgi:hypothetical protein